MLCQKYFVLCYSYLQTLCWVLLLGGRRSSARARPREVTMEGVVRAMQRCVTSGSDWEVDDDIVAEAWISRDELLQQLPQPDLLSTPEPTCPDNFFGSAVFAILLKILSGFSTHGQIHMSTLPSGQRHDFRPHSSRTTYIMRATGRQVS